MIWSDDGGGKEKVRSSGGRSFQRREPQGSTWKEAYYDIVKSHERRTLFKIETKWSKTSVEMSLYSSDSTIWRSRHKQEVNYRELQRRLYSVKKFFCDWG